MSTSSRNERTRAGCWTCRARRKKCDETRPRCMQCSKLGLQCEGYGMRLKWGKPRIRMPQSSGCKMMKTKASSSPSTPMPDNSASNEAFVYYFGEKLYQSLSSTEREIMQNFIEWGALVLLARVKVHAEKYFEIFVGSPLLLYMCLAYQVTLEQRHAPLVDRYYIRSIEEFRHELAQPVRARRETTIYSGLILCSISMTRGLPWTFHMKGVSSILNSGQNGIHNEDSKTQPRDYVFFIGILDLPTHTLGRRTEYLHIWYQNCRFHSGIEDGLGLPCSLVDLLCAIAEPDIEKRLSAWPGEDGTQVQTQIWDLTRHAGIVAAQKHNSASGIGAEAVGSAVNQIISTIRHLRSQLGVFDYTPWSGLLFPLVTAASQPSCLSAMDKELIIESVTDLSSGTLEQYPYYGNIVKALREFWDRGAGRSLEEVVVDLELELGLF